MNLELFKSLAKYPFLYNSSFFDSPELSQNKTCLEKCSHRDCMNLFSSSSNYAEYICSKGYNNILLILSDTKFILNGLIYKDNKFVPTGRKEVRKNWIVDKSEVSRFLKKLEEIEKHILIQANEAAEKNFSMFHDFKTSMTIFFNCTQSIINQLPGSTFQEKLDNSDKAYKDLYNSLKLITSQLGMIDVIINPKSIRYGTQRQINIYRLFEKIKTLFGHLTIRKKDINIKLLPEGYINDSICYESIEFIPLILLDNALKYSMPSSDIEIKFENHHKMIKVMVKSIGPFVNDENKEKIFEKFFRDESGQAFSKEGIGMGLWIAQQILIAHGSKLSYHRDTKETRPIGLNVFEFDLATI